MTLKEKIQENLKEALRGGREEEVSVLRMVSSAIANFEIEKRGKGGDREATEEEVEVVLQKELKKRNESFRAYQDAGRNDLADKEQMEAKIIEKYLPEALSKEELEKIVDEVLEGGVEKDFGKIMREVMAKTKGRADGKEVGEIVKSKI